MSLIFEYMLPTRLDGGYQPLSWWLGRRRDVVPELNDAGRLDVYPARGESPIGESLFSYTPGCAHAMARQFEAAATRLRDDELALISQALLGVPQMYAVALQPAGPLVTLAGIQLSGPLTADCACVYPTLASQAQVDALYGAARALLRDDASAELGSYEYRDVAVRRDALLEALVGEATRIDEAYRLYGLRPELAIY